MENNNIDEMLPKLKEGTKGTITKNIDQNEYEKEQIKKSKHQSIVALTMIIIGYILLSINFIVKKYIDSFIGWLAFFLFGGIPVVLGLILLFISFILTALAYKNDKENKLLSTNLFFLILPLIIFVIGFILSRAI